MLKFGRCRESPAGSSNLSCTSEVGKRKKLKRNIKMEMSFLSTSPNTEFLLAALSYLTSQKHPDIQGVNFLNSWLCYGVPWSTNSKIRKHLKVASQICRCFEIPWQVCFSLSGRSSGYNREKCPTRIQIILFPAHSL